MLRHHMALLWSAKSNWFVAINMWPRCGQTIIKQHTITHYESAMDLDAPFQGKLQCLSLIPHNPTGNTQFR